MRLIRVQKAWLICAPFREGGVSAPHRNQSQRAPIGELGEPAAEKSAKMHGTCSRIVCSSAMSARDSSLTLENDMGGMGQWLAQSVTAALSLPLHRPRCHNLPADIVVPRRSIALSLNSLSLGYRRAKTRPRRVLCLLTLAQ